MYSIYELCAHKCYKIFKLLKSYFIYNSSSGYSKLYSTTGTNTSNTSNTCNGYIFDKKYYTLYIYIEDSVTEDIKNKYINSASQNNIFLENYLKNWSNSSDYQPLSDSESCSGSEPCSVNDSSFDDISAYCFDAGFDLFCPEYINSIGAQKVVVDHKIKCCMKMGNRFVGYYLYPRSSTGTKTPLRMVNSVGIIDSGYRGNIKAVFDNINGYDFQEYDLDAGNRFVQICPPNLEYPMKIIIVDSIACLGRSRRGEGGFGSTGK